MFKELIWVGAGGAVGSMARYLVGLGLRVVFPITFPIGTLVVNVLGCLAIGYLAKYAENPAIWLPCAVGLLGGFTTFSAFGLETVTLLRMQMVPLAFANVVFSLVAGLGAVYLALKDFTLK